jgi:hypothetical protein
MDNECIVQNWAASIEYHEKKVSEDKAEIILSSMNPKGNTKDKAHDFEFTNNLNAHLKLKGFDIPFSFDKSDPINDTIITEIINDFIQKMGFTDRPFLLYRHDDTEHLHYHLLVSNTNWSGTTNEKLRGFYRKEVTLLAREYEKKYGLRELNEMNSNQQNPTSNELNAEKYKYQNALIAADKDGIINLSDAQKLHLKQNKLNNKEIKSYLRDEFVPLMTILHKNGYLTKTLKTQLIEQLDNIIQSIPADEFTYKKYVDAVKARGLYIRELQKTDPKIITYGINDGNTFTYFKSNRLPERFSYVNLINNKQNSYTIDQQKKYLLNILTKARNQAKNYDQYKTILLAKGIEIEEKSNPNFEIYALKYKQLNIKNSHSFASSDIGRNFSYSNLQKHFNKNLITTTQEDFVIGKPKNKIDPVTQKQSPKNNQINPEKQPKKDVTRKAKIGEEDDEEKMKGKGMT